MRAMKLDLNSISIVDVENDLHALQKAVGGRIETVGLKDGAVMIVDEEGMLKQYPHNDLASYISRRHIYGTALIVGVDGEEFDDVPDQYYVWLGN
ncbi:MAG: DUF3846 domain-containing protein [Oscillospiraceae bacterium]|nr:DUF3846 domain-containing protein [Oscillospiraceae bacterium]